MTMTQNLRYYNQVSETETLLRMNMETEEDGMSVRWLLFTLNDLVGGITKNHSTEW